ncbi:MAG TPA: hypothetical protein VFW07_19415 [Parafilimonas sp.]|nr:hypothetical protein [Parafilimonas sp.]
MSKLFPYTFLIIQRVRDYVSDFYPLNIDIKSSIKELNPYFTHPKHINFYNKLFYTKMSQSVNKEVEKNSLISILAADTIQLAKGGGWKISNRKEISKLGSVGTSFSLPRSYFINPNEYELRKGIEMKLDWDDSEFDEIAKILINE